MINTISVNSELFNNYLDILVNRLFKIIPLYEEHNEGLYVYTQSLLFELYGLIESVEDMNKKPEYVILVSTLESIADSVLFDDTQKIVRRETLKCMDVVKKMKPVAIGSDVS